MLPPVDGIIGWSTYYSIAGELALGVCITKNQPADQLSYHPSPDQGL